MLWSWLDASDTRFRLMLPGVPEEAPNMMSMFVEPLQWLDVTICDNVVKVRIARKMCVPLQCSYNGGRQWKIRRRTSYRHRLMIVDWRNVEAVNDL